MNIFSKKHPAALVIYFGLLQLLLLITMHPLVISIALSGALAYLICLTSWRYTLVEVSYYGLFSLLIAVMYAAFAHNGVTPLFFYNDHAVTKEALTRGTMLGLTFLTSIFWIKTYLRTMQTNHFLFLFTKIHPALGLFTSMCFRFFPYLQELWQQNKRGQQGGHYFYTTSRFERLGRLLLLQLHTLTQAIDAVFWKPAIMHSKGYQKKRTQFQLFKWQLADTIFLLTVFVIFGLLIGQLGSPFEYFPALQSIHLSPTILCGLGMFYWLPAIIEGKELIKWHYAQSKI